MVGSNRSSIPRSSSSSSTVRSATTPLNLSSPPAQDPNALMTDVPTPPPASQAGGQIHLSRAADGSLVVQIVDNGQVRLLQIPGDKVKELLWHVISVLSHPQDPPPQPLPSSTQGMPIVNEAFWMAGPTPQGAQVAFWIPGLGFCAFFFTRNSCARLGTFLVQAGQLADPAASPAKN